MIVCMKAMTPTEFFWSRVEKTSGCWIWLGAKTTKDYGYVNKGDDGKRIYAHRFSYELHYGKIPDGLVIDHDPCGRHDCVNPAHLNAVTQPANTRRERLARTTCSRGHPWDEANTYRRPDKGTRQCRACARTPK